MGDFEYSVLGNLEIRRSDGQVIPITAAKQRALLGALLLEAGHLVSKGRLIERLWGQQPPASAVNTLESLVSRLRRVLTATGRAEDSDLVIQQPGYVLDIQRSQLDRARFEELTAIGRADLRAGDPAAAAARLREALQLWRGEPLADVEFAIPDDAALTALRERRRQAREDRIEAELLIGHHLEVIAELPGLIAGDPLQERLHALLMKAFYLAGRRADALAAYDTVRRRLADELGVDPGPDLQKLHREILHDDLETMPGEATAPTLVLAPAQLPPDVYGFTGRISELAALDALLDKAGEQPTAVLISAVSGSAGVGKTTLAVHWAHRMADRFPDGQLHVDLRGFSPGGQVVTPAEAVRRFLDALDVPPQRIPVDLDALAALYRTQMAGRRTLVLLDNARDSDQVRPLLPAAKGCLVLVTSRKQLTSLVAVHGAHSIDLDVLPVDEARELLARRLGPDRVAAEPAAVEEIITRCARLPLALALVAAHAISRPRTSLRLLAGELADAQQRWQTLTGDDPHTDLKAVFSWSYHALTPAAARLFRLLGLHPGPDISAPAAASLAGLAPHDVRPLLAELTGASLLTEPANGRYTFHDLLRDYATWLADTIDTDVQRHNASGRILDHYLHTAYSAAKLLYPTRDPVPLAPPQTGVTPEPLNGHTQALDWFTAQQPVLLATVAHAAATGFDTHTWQLAWTLQDVLHRRGHWHDLVVVTQTAVAATQRLADPTAQARAHRFLAAAHTLLGCFDDAHTQLHHALDLVTRTGDQTGQAHTHSSLGYLWERRGQPTQALHHARQALHLYQATGNQTGQADALNAIGWCHTLLGEHRQALIHCEQALTLHQQLGALEGQASTLDSLGHAHHHLGQHTQAITCYQHAIALSSDLGDRHGEADSLNNLGDTHHATGNSQAAREAWQQALAILDDLDHPDAAPVRVKLSKLDMR